MQSVNLRPWLLAALLSSCGSNEPATDGAPVADEPLPPVDCNRGAEQPSPAGDNFARQSGVDYASCGQQRRAFLPACCATATAGYDCLVAARDSCSPARLAESFGTIEGDTIFTDYFVVPVDGGCEVVVVTDDGQDSYRDTSFPAVSMRHCGLARTRAAASADTCPILQLDACAQ